MKSALVTGSAGFIGRHITTALRADGWHVFDIDIATGRDCRHVFATDARFNLVVHCAAVIGGRATIDGDPLAVAVDFELDASMFRYAARTRPDRVIYFSSSAAYPTRLQHKNKHRPLRERDIDLEWVDTPDAVYGWVKLTGEMLAQHLRGAGVPVTVLRPFSGYGTDQSLDYPFPSFIDRALRRADPFDIWGDGTQTRDWVHVDDIVATVLACIDGGIDGPLNIGTGQATPFRDLAEMVCRAAGYSPHFEYHPAAPTGVHHRVADVEASHRLWAPTIDLHDGIARALHASKAAA